ncbi:MAG: hypothetical protein COY40_04435 [Alphaproteobacteria bacterium CG_4_10_14_0_8_um_filter_53_9]|nr:MAG: hypothetical protein COY40_04435 [Alphaproteobacteria bacterium CG_4_10_14_0_8_um_filter_53_9]
MRMTPPSASYPPLTSRLSASYRAFTRLLPLICLSLTLLSLVACGMRVAPKEPEGKQYPGAQY